MLEIEIGKRDTLLEKQKRENEEKLFKLEKSKQEDIETSVELRLAVHAR